MDYTKLSKKNLVDILENVVEVLEGVNSSKNNPIEQYKQIEDNPLESLIGTIPFLLTNKALFEKNQDIADFAKRLDIYIPTPEKKKREDIIGRIIFAILDFDRYRIAELNSAIKSIKGTVDSKKDKSNFFKEWENVIKNIKI